MDAADHRRDRVPAFPGAFDPVGRRLHRVAGLLDVIPSPFDGIADLFLHGHVCLLSDRKSEGRGDNDHERAAIHHAKILRLFGRHVERLEQAFREGASVAVVDVDEAGVHAVVKEITANGGKAKGIVADLREDANARRIVRNRECLRRPGLRLEPPRPSRTGLGRWHRDGRLRAGGWPRPALADRRHRGGRARAQGAAAAACSIPSRPRAWSVSQASRQLAQQPVTPPSSGYGRSALTGQAAGLPAARARCDHFTTTLATLTRNDNATARQG